MGLWKVDTVQSCGTEEIMAQVKWTTTNHTKDRSSSKEGDVYMVGLGVLYYELLPENWTVNSNKYCPQFDQLKAALAEKHPELVNRKHIIFHQDDTRLLVSLMIRQKLLLPGWEVLIYLLYSQDIATLDFHSQNSLNGKKKFNSLEDCKRHVEQFLAQKDKFWDGGIMKLPEKWQKVVKQRVEYVT